MLAELRISPSGNRVGMASASDGSKLSLHLVILPKLWKYSGPSSYKLPAAYEGQIFVTAYEGDSLAYETGGPFDALIEELLNLHTGSGLFELRYCRELPLTDAKGDLNSALDLFTLLNRTMNPEIKESIPVTEAHGISEMFARKQLVDLVQQMKRQIHQGYVESFVRIEPLRGRIDVGDLGLALLEKRTHVLCRYDELTSGIPLFRLIVTALEIASKNGGVVDAVLDRALGGVRAHAASARKQLHDIRAYGVAEANRIANRISLSSVNPMWREAFASAHRVLRLAQESLGTGSQRVDLEQLLIRTDDLWEYLVVEAARLKWGPGAVYHSKPGNLAHGLNVPAPWRRQVTSSTAGRAIDSYPDLVVVTGGQVWCADAKYKRRKADPDRNDLYQIYAYSHLTSISATEARTTSCALLYPVAPGRDHGLEATLFRQPSDDLDLRLDVLTLPWPSQDDLRKGLSHYLHDLSLCFPELSKESETRRP